MREIRAQGSSRVLIELRTPAKDPNRSQIAATQERFLRKSKLHPAHRYKYQAPLAMRIDAKDLLAVLNSPDVLAVSHDSVERVGSAD